MKNYFESIDELILYTEEAIGKPMKEFDVNNRLKDTSSKGSIGQVIEEGFFGYKINNISGADFANLGVELKVTPYKWVNNSTLVSAKERLVINMINFMKDYEYDFYESDLYEKIDKILLLFYEHQQEVDKSEYYISNKFLFDFSKIDEEDKQIIISDYNKIVKKILDGRAHEISESDTLYLGACPKAANREKGQVTQPFSDVLAMKRAFCFKSPYMTQLLRNQVFKNSPSREKFIKDISILKSNSFEEVILRNFKPFYGMTLNDLDEKLKIVVNRNNKSYIKNYVSRMLDSNKSINQIEDYDEFVKANIKIKTIRVLKNGTIRESMSFPSFRFLDLIQEDWEESTLRNQFVNEKYLFCIFDEISEFNYKFREAMLWSMPEIDLDSKVKHVWSHTKETILNGVQLYPVQQKSNIIIKNNFIKISDDLIVHVRPHTNKSIYKFEDGKIFGNGSLTSDGDMLPDGRIMTKQCFFINSKYIEKIINK